MWIVPSRSRPHNIRRLLAACAWMIEPVLVRLDHDDPLLSAYLEIEFPYNWAVVVGRRAPLSEIYNEIYGSNPYVLYYGFLADDVVPETDGWYWMLIGAAQLDGMAVPAGGETTGGCPHFVLGGDLVRSVGWLALPGLDRTYIDTVWRDIARARGVYRYLPQTILEHRHFSNGKALMDSTYRKLKKAEDRRIYESFKQETLCSFIPK